MSRINRYATGSNRTAVVHVDIYDVVQGLDQLDSIARMKISKAEHMLAMGPYLSAGIMCSILYFSSLFIER